MSSATVVLYLYLPECDRRYAYLLEQKKISSELFLCQKAPFIVTEEYYLNFIVPSMALPSHSHSFSADQQCLLVDAV